MCEDRIRKKTGLLTPNILWWRSTFLARHFTVWHLSPFPQSFTTCIFSAWNLIKIMVVVCQASFLRQWRKLWKFHVQKILEMRTHYDTDIHSYIDKIVAADKKMHSVLFVVCVIVRTLTVLHSLILAKNWGDVRQHLDNKSKPKRRKKGWDKSIILFANNKVCKRFLEPPGSPVNLRLLRGQAPEASRVYLEWDAPPLVGKETHDGAPISGLSGVVHVPGDFATSTAAATTSGGTTTTTMLTTTTANLASPAFPPILRYVLEFTESAEIPSFSKMMEIAGEKTQVKVDNLKPALVYLFRVRAINSAGSGPPSVHLLVRTANVPPSVPPNNVHSPSLSLFLYSVASI